MKCSLSFVICFLLILTVAKGQDFSNKGKEFWIAYPSHLDGSSSVMGLYITSGVATKGKLQLGNGSPTDFEVQANVITRIFLNSSGTGTTSGTLPMYFASNSSVYINKVTDGIQAASAIKITSEDAVVVYAHIIRTARSGATLVLPTQVLGNEYIVASMNSVSSTQNATGNGSPGGSSEIVVIATQDNTTLEITSSVDVGTNRIAGTPYTITLAAAGDCYQLQSAAKGDLSGTKIVSKSSGSSGGCKPIAVYSASTWSAFDCSTGTSGDNLFQQLFPTRSWGKTFVTAPFINRTDDIFRIYVQNSSTTVTVQENGNTVTLDASQYNSVGRFYAYRTNNPIIIKGTEPILVAQYITSAGCKTGCLTTNTPTCYGDPEMVLLNPVEQTLNDITFFSAVAGFISQGAGQGATNVVNHYVNIIISKNFTNTVKIDNASPKGSFVDIPGSHYAYLQEDVTTSSTTNPVHRITADTGFAAIVYGYGNVESYGYNGGTNLKDFTARPAFQNPFNRIDSAVTCANTPFTFSVPISFKPSSITWDFSTAPNISPNTTVKPSTITADSTVNVNGIQINYYGTGTTYMFNKANTALLRDTVKMYTTSATPDGCGSTDQVFVIPIKAIERPFSDFTISHKGCVDDSVYLTDKTIYGGTLTNRVWDFGDNTSETRIDTTIFSKKYTSSSTYAIRLKAYSDIGCVSNETTKVITIVKKPVAGFTQQPVTCEGADISFADASKSSGAVLTKWFWNLDDGGTILANTTNAPVKTKYPIWGIKNVRLIVETGNGCQSDTLAQTVKINPLPKIGFIVPEVCLNDANAQFEDTSTIVEGNIVSYTWAFNTDTPPVVPGPSSATGTGKKPIVKYQKADNYKVSLTAVSDKGCNATVTQQLTVNGATPKAGLEMANNAPYCGTKAVKLKNISTVDFGNITRLEIYWDFAGQPTIKETDENPVPDKVYAYSYPNPPAPKQYTIRLVAYSGGASCVSETSKVITLYPQPKAGFSAAPVQLCSGDTVVFTDSSKPSSGTISQWHWDFGNGELSSIQNPVKIYNDSGVLAISLYIINSDGCRSDTAVKELIVYPNPQLALPETRNVLEGGITILKPLWVYGKSLSYKWVPPVWLSSDTAMEPKVTPLADITYRLLLTAEGGCSVSDEIFIRVLKSPEVPNAFSPNGDGINDVWNIKYLDSYTDATVDVYNRYGQVVYRSAGYLTPWNGTYQSRPLPVGTYYYLINPRNGRPLIAGAVTIIK